MRIVTLTIVGLLLYHVAAAGDPAPAESLSQSDQKRLEGRWQVVELVVDGKSTAEEDARKLMVVNGADGSWSALHDGSKVSRGTSTLDPTASPKTIDFTPTAGGGTGMMHLGIYELKEKTRRLCFAPAGGTRPTEFASLPGSGHVLVRLERIEAD